ncbi:MAG: hypothetical protein IK122_00800 [Alphaproteobacteria bacterium]|nr:hypothetical protein [Alphaproteobacteria bacterium]MBR6502588.1 hypothetical protein [Clostridia bacterium]
MLFNEITKTPVCIAAIICGTIILICLIACISDMVKTAIKEKTARVLDEQKYFYSRLTANDIRAMAGIPTFETITKDEFDKMFPTQEPQQKQTIDFPNKTIETRPANPTFDAETVNRPLNEKYH